MNVDGTDVRRLTNTPGYDGGPFFSPDGKRIVYRAYHPTDSTELAAVSRAAAPVDRAAEQDGDLGDERRRERPAPDHAPGRRQLRALLHAGRQADHLLVELQESAQRRVRSLSRERRRQRARAGDDRRRASTAFRNSAPTGSSSCGHRAATRPASTSSTCSSRTGSRSIASARTILTRSIRCSAVGARCHLSRHHPDRADHGRQAVKIIGQAEVMVIERWGRFNRVARSGLNILDPLHGAAARRSTSATSRRIRAA